LHLKHLLKRGALLAAANWQAVAVQFLAEATFQVLLAVPIIGAAILVAVLLGADLADLLQGSLREIFGQIAGALTSQPVALASFFTAFAMVLLGGSVLMFLAKGGTVEVMLAADRAAGPIEREPLTLRSLRQAAAFSLERFTAGCSRLFSTYLRLGAVLLLVYAASGAVYLAFVVYGYRAAGGRAVLVGWTLVAALAAVALVAWITVVNLFYLLVQIAAAADGRGVAQAMRSVARFARAERRELFAVFAVVLALVLAATLASALAWSGVGLVAFIPIVGLAVLPLQLVALLLRGLIFQYIGLAALGAYAALYRGYAMRQHPATGHPIGKPLDAVPSSPLGHPA
jgi:hypothetical protein